MLIAFSGMEIFPIFGKYEKVSRIIVFTFLLLYIEVMCWGIYSQLSSDLSPAH
jgi:hypothetical protein